MDRVNSTMELTQFRRKSNMATSVNPTAAALKAQALAKAEELTKATTEVEAIADQATQAVKSEIQKSGIAHRLDLHFTKLTRIRLKDKPTLIVIKSPNIPTTVDCIATKKKSGEGIKVTVNDRAVKHVGTDKQPTTQEQDEANELISNLTGAIGRAVTAYINKVFDICRTWDQLEGAAIEQEEEERKATYERWSKKVSD